jgi:hypothetical protein
MISHELPEKEPGGLLPDLAVIGVLDHNQHQRGGGSERILGGAASDPP